MTPVHVVTGFLGAGKTTLLLAHLASGRAGGRSAVVVNDFGEAQFDATLLGGAALVKDIPGGCVCCTAPQELVPAVRALLADAPARIFIEATGLARPADIVDTLRRAFTGGEIELTPVVAVVDPSRWAQGEASGLLQTQLDAADIWVLSARDAAEAHTAQLKAAGAERHPPLLAIEVTTRAQVPEGLFDVRASGLRAWRPAAAERPSTEGWAVASGQWGPEVVFDMGELRRLLNETGAERVKGVFHTDIGWYRMERAGGALDRSPSAFHSHSRMDVIVSGELTQAKALVDAVGAARYVAPAPGTVPEVQVVSASGAAVAFTRASLMQLPGQVEDVSAYVPGREGQGVWLAEVLAATAAPEGASFVLVASDGMTTQPVKAADVGEAIVLHSLDGAPYPEGAGGPFRIFVPPDKSKSACANVKKLVRVMLEA